MKMRGKVLLIFVVIFAGLSPLQGNAAGRIEVEEKLGQSVPLDAVFYDEDGRRVTLREIIKRPTIVSLVYFGCSHNCPILLGGLAEVLPKVEFDPSRDYSLITVSFDDSDTPQAAREKKRNYLGATGKAFPEASWRFLTGDMENIKRFSDAVGFNFRKEKGGFSHPVALIFLSSEGKVVRYLYGRTFLPFDITMALTEALKGNTRLSVQRLRLFCFSYDPPARAYVYNILKVYGTMTLLFVVSFFVYLAVTGRGAGK